MSDADAPVVAAQGRPRLEIRQISWGDLGECVRLAWSDFSRAPAYSLFFGAVYAFGGMALVALFFFLHMPYVGYPLAMGFALIAPFVAAGTYEISRRLERGETLTWKGVLGGFWKRAGTELGWMALVTGFALIIWVDFAIFLFLMFYGLHVPTFQEFVVAVFTTPRGIIFAIVGNLFGALIATGVFSITVVSFPLLADRELDFVTAMITSVRCVIANPVRLIVWAALIAILLALSIIPGFIGLFVILPVLGHASWHLYRRLVV